MAKRLLLVLFFGLLATPLLKAQQGSLASKLPAETLLYFEIPDVQGLIADSQKSALVRMYNEESMQSFLGQSLGLLEQGWEEFRSEAMRQGVPAGLMEWSALKSVECGFSMRAPDSLAGGPPEPEICVGGSMQLDGQLATELFGFLNAMMTAEGVAEFVDGADGGHLLIPMGPSEKFKIWQDGDRIYGWAQTGEFGGGSLNGAGHFKKARSRALQAGGIYAYFDLGTMMRFAQTMSQYGDPQAAELMSSLWEKMGLNALGPLSIGSGWEENGDSVSVFAMDLDESAKNAGVFAAMNQARVDLSLLDYIPEGATSFSLASSDMSMGLDFALEFMDDLVQMDAGGATIGEMWRSEEPNSYDWLIGDKRGLLEKGLKGFGSRMFSYSESSGNMMGGPAAGGMFLEVSDVTAVRRFLSEFMPAALELMSAVDDLPLKMEIRNIPISEENEQGEKIVREGPEYYVFKVNSRNLPSEMRQMSMVFAQLSPSFGVTDDGWLAMGLSQVGVRNALRKGVAKPQKNVLANGEVKSFIDGLPQNVMSVQWSDWRKDTQAALEMASAMAPMMAMQEGMDQIPVDLNSLPDPKAVVSNMSPMETYSYQDGSSFITKSRGFVNLSDLFLLGGVGASVAPVFLIGQSTSYEEPLMVAPHEGDAAEEIEEEPEEEVVIQEVSSSMTAEEKSKTMAELNRLKSGLLVYEMTFQKYPDKLDDLTKPTQDWPFGFLPEPEKGLRQDPWGNDFHYKRNGKEYKLYSVGPNGKDDGGAGDDLQGK